MLTITIRPEEQYDELKNEFFTPKTQVLQLEHSLVSLSKWESKWHKPFLSKEIKSTEETIDYIRCMTLTQNVDPVTYTYLSDKNLEEIDRYIGDKMTATTFSNQDNRPNTEIITSEVIYGAMVALNIPFECQKWHLNRLLTLINVCRLKNNPPKKMSQKDVAAYYKRLNEERKAKMHTEG